MTAIKLAKNPELNEGERYSRNGRFVLSETVEFASLSGLPGAEWRSEPKYWVNLPPLLYKSSGSWPWREIKVGEGFFVPDANKVRWISYRAKDGAEFESLAGERRGINGIWVKRLK